MTLFGESPYDDTTLTAIRHALRGDVVADADPDFVPWLQRIADALGWMPAELDVTGARFNFALGEQDVYAVWLTPTSAGLEFAVLASIHFTTADALVERMALYLLKRNRMSPLGKWCVLHTAVSQIFACIYRLGRLAEDPELISDIAQMLLTECVETDREIRLWLSVQTSE